MIAVYPKMRVGQVRITNTFAAILPGYLRGMTLTLSKVLMLAACVLFVIASLAAGGVLPDLTAWAFGFGALSAWALAAVV